jgi:ubiquitin-conjugating enzyme E2 Q
MGGRKEFLRDVAAAAEYHIAGLSNIARGDDAEDLECCFTPVDPRLRSFKIKALARDVSEYPQGNAYFLFTDDSNNPPQVVSDVLSRLADESGGLTVSSLFECVAAALHTALEDGSNGNPISVEEEEPLSEDCGQDQDDSDEYDDEAWPDDFETQRSQTTFKRYSINPEAAKKLNKRIRQDVRAIRTAGFYGKVCLSPSIFKSDHDVIAGILHGMKADSQSCVLSISIRIRRLGLSEEAIQAWDLQKNQYAILLIRYLSGYKTYDAVISEPPSSHGIEFRVGVSHSRRPTVTQAMAAFANSNGTIREDPEDGYSGQGFAQPDFHRLFISGSLNEFMNTQLSSLVKIRNSTGTGWDGAKRFFQENQGRANSSISLSSNDASGELYSGISSTQTEQPTIVTADHLADANGVPLSYPLIAMQFFIRYLTRCTEFCLVCK